MYKVYLHMYVQLNNSTGAFMNLNSAFLCPPGDKGPQRLYNHTLSLSNLPVLFRIQNRETARSKGGK